MGLLGGRYLEKKRDQKRTDLYKNNVENNNHQ